jgi:hypothetical protein
MSRIISFPQAFALNKGAHYRFNACFTGLPIKTLLNSSGYSFTQPAFQTPAPNLYNVSLPVYSLCNSKNTDSAGLIFKYGGNLVETAIKWTNGKSLGNWYQIQRHGNAPTGGSVFSDGKVLKISCGPTTSLLNRSLIHDVKYQRSGTEITEQSGTVGGYLQPQDPDFTSVYFKGYVENFNFNTIDPTSNLPLGYHTQFYVGYRFAHSQSINANVGSVPLPIFIGTAKGFGFIGIRLNNTTFTWHCVVIASNEVNTSDTAFCFAHNTGLSIFGSNKLQVTFNNGTITWYANGNQVATTSISTLVANGHFFDGNTNPNTENPMYACVMSIKGGSIVVPPGSFTICVEEAAVFRSLSSINVPINRFEDTDTEVTETDIDYQITGLHLLKKLK